MALQILPPRKSRRLVALCPDVMHDEFMGLVDLTGESAGVIIRGLVSDAIARGRRGEPLVPRLVAGVPIVTGG